MATAKDILESIIVGDSVVTIIIDQNLREMTIPKGITNLGVESDDDVLSLKFRIPRYYGNVDLSEFEIRINYLNANGDGDIYNVNNPDILDNIIEFEWVVGRHATSYVGDVNFNVCLRKYSDDGAVIDKEFNTKVSKLPVLEGLETSKAIDMNSVDIEKILNNQY